jgi:hypothetical protein
MKKNLQSLWQLLLLTAFLSANFTSYGQSPGKPAKKPVPAAVLEHIRKNKQKLELEDADLAELELSSETDSKKSGMKHYYLKQLHQGIEIHGAVTNVSTDRNDNVVSMGNRFHKQVGKKIKSKQVGLTAEAAVAAAARYLKTSLKEPLTVKERGAGLNREVLFSTGGISLEPIPARLVYQPMEDGSLRLAWEVSIYELDAQNWWNLRLDATTGEVLDKDNMVVHCEFDNNGPGGKFLHNNHSHKLISSQLAIPQAKAENTAFTNAYNVFAMPLESPSHGPRTFVSNSVADNVASPSGWHSTGTTNYTITRGNNVYAYDDPDNTGYIGAAQDTYGTSPDGGPSLVFDYPIDFTKQPVAYKDAAITNLFYWSNITHDIWYQYGFDEQSGNFQANNFGRGGLGGDHVMAEAQDSRNIPNPPPGVTTRNNANFATTPEGVRPRMQMYLWSGIPDQNLFRVTSPSSIAAAYPALEASFSAKLTSTPITGKLVVAAAQSGVADQGCDAFSNAADIKGNIAVVYRGTCGFANKVQNAQIAGAIAVVVINNQPGTILMGGTSTNPTPAITIPAVSITQADGAIIRSELNKGIEVTVTLKNDGSGPEIDGDFDNGIIAHEYGHGISIRLAGGPAVTNCLTNAEQMGEGWSDWFGLMMTMKAGDTPDKVRGIGTYASGQPTTGQGIRPAPYSTSFNVNSFTYAATNNAAISQPHGIGFVWSTMLWDMTWALIDRYGFNQDLYNGTGGNNMAMQLVIDGLKLQACRPGFVDGRDAILLADRINYGGANQELIWKAFAKRGLGFNAKQGSSTSRFDQVEAFDLPSAYMCTTPLTVAAVPTSTVFTGGDATVVYLGYGPQNVILQASGDATNQYTWSPAAGLSDATVADPVFTPTAAGTYTFRVTAVNKDQCTKTESITIKVVDVRCGDAKKVAQVLVCVDGVAECVAPQAVHRLLTQAKGKLGACGTTAAGRVSAEDREDVSGAQVSAWPNPFSRSVTIDIVPESSGYATYEVSSPQGVLVRRLFAGPVESGRLLRLELDGSGLPSGVYVGRFISEGNVHTLKLILEK